VILAIETSCDDTCAAVVTDAGEVVSNVVASQGVHARFGGVVPEWASRHHLEFANAVVDQSLADVSLDDITLVAVTQGPGLVGALLVGVATAKGIAAARRLPLAAVDHMQGHVAANFLQPDPFEPPFVCLLASGGHTLLAHVRDHEGYETVGAGDGREALRTLEATKPDVVLLDLVMPGMDGLEMLETLHRHPQWKALPVVVLTALSDTHTVNRAQQLGAKAFLVKATFSVAEMLDQVKRYAGSHA